LYDAPNLGHGAARDEHDIAFFRDQGKPFPLPTGEQQKACKTRPIGALPPTVSSKLLAEMET